MSITQSSRRVDQVDLCAEPGTLYRALSGLERRGWVRPLAGAGHRDSYEIAATWPGRAGHGDAPGRARRPRPCVAVVADTGLPAAILTTA